MSNSLLGYGNNADTSTLSGGSWLVDLPLTNLQNRILAKVARASDMTNASTQFTFALPADTPIRLIALAGHNFSINSLIRVTNNLGMDTGWLDVWQPVYSQDLLEWQSLNFWSGKYTQAQLANFSHNWVFDCGSDISATSWTIEVDDTTNPDGFVQIGRLFIGQAWQTVVNISYGSSLAWEDTSGITSALSGAEYYNRKTPFRVARFTTGFMSEDEGLAAAFDLQAAVGTTREVVFLWNPADTIHAIRRQFLGRIRVLNQLEFPNPDLTSQAWEVKEIL